MLVYVYGQRKLKSQTLDADICSKNIIFIYLLYIVNNDYDDNDNDDNKNDALFRRKWCVYHEGMHCCFQTYDNSISVGINRQPYDVTIVTPQEF